MRNKKIKNIVLMILSIFPLKVFIHYFIYPTTYQKKIVVGSSATNNHYYEDSNFETRSESIGLHFDSIFIEELWLFIPAFIIVLFTGWYFGVFDKKNT